MRFFVFILLVLHVHFVVVAQSIAWNRLELSRDFVGADGKVEYTLRLDEDFYYECRFCPTLLLYVSMNEFGYSITTYDMEDTLSSFVGNWLVGNKGDMSSESTTRHQGNYLNHAKIDGETGYATYNLEGTAPQDYYLIFAVENLDDYVNEVPDPRYAYGWAHVSVNGDMSLSLLGSAMSLDGSPLVVGAIPEPSAGVLLLLGLAGLVLRRRPQAAEFLL